MGTVVDGRKTTQHDYVCILCAVDSKVQERDCIKSAKSGTSNLHLHHNNANQLHKEGLARAEGPAPQAVGHKRNRESQHDSNLKQGRLGVGQFGFTTSSTPKPSCQYTHDQLQRQHTRALIVHHRPAAAADDKELRILLKMLSPAYVPPAARTQELHRKEFLVDLREQLLLQLVRDDCVHEVVVDGVKKLRPMNGLPLLSISFDLSPTGLKGVKAIALRLHYCRPDFVRKNITLAVDAFRGE